MKTRRAFLGTVGGAAAGAVLRRRASAQTDRRPNIVLMMADDMGFECLKCNGGSSYETPILDAFAAEGLRFEHCYSQPLCTPSRVKIMTGRSNGKNYIAFGTLKQGETTFGHIMQAAGYKTCIAGKWQLSGAFGHRGTLPEEAGFDTYCLWQVDSDTKGSRYWNPSLIRDGKPIEGLEDHYGPDVLSSFVMDFMEAHRDQPFFVYYPMVLTHGPHVPTPDSKEGDADSKRDTKYFPDMINYAEKLLANISSKLSELGLRENTLLIFTADNGTDKKITSEFRGRLIKGGKATTPDAGTRVPLIMQWKGVTPEGKVSQALIDFTDFAPTFADMARAPIPERLDGTSFLPHLRGETDETKQWVFCHYEKGKTGPEDETPPEPNGKPAFKRFVRNQRYKLYDNGNLFDVPSDPEEKAPLTGAPEIRQRLQGVLDRAVEDLKQ